MLRRRKRRRTKRVTLDVIAAYLDSDDAAPQTLLRIIQGRLDEAFPDKQMRASLCEVDAGRYHGAAIKIDTRLRVAGRPVVFYVLMRRTLLVLLDLGQVVAPFRIGTLLDYIATHQGVRLRQLGGLVCRAAPDRTDWIELIHRALNCVRTCAMVDRLPLDDPFGLLYNEACENNG